jgi:hypothetical protein
MVSTARKILYCFLLSAVICTGMVILFFTDIFDSAVINFLSAATVFVFAAFFLALFLLAFVCFILWQRFQRRNSAKEPQALSDNTGSADEIFELEEISNCCDGGAFLFSRPFSFFPGNPQMLQGISYDTQHDVLYEENGIHFINSSVFDSDYNGKELNDDFAQLVESVINRT